MKRIGKLLLSFTLMTSLLFGCSNTTANGTLKVGVREDIMGLGYYNPDTNEYYGLEIDIARELARDLGMELQLVSVTPSERENALSNEEVDCIIAAYSIQPSRLELFSFSNAYYTAYISVVVEKSSLIHRLSDVVGLKVGVLKGANAKDRLLDKLVEMQLINKADLKDTRLVEYDSYEALARALEEGKVDAICLDEEIAKGYMDEDCMILSDKVAQEEYGVASAKDSAMSEKINSAIATMLEEGTIDQLIDKWN